jgi:hypothetical protein
MSSGLRGSAMQREAVSISPSLRSTSPNSITPPSLVMLPPSKALHGTSAKTAELNRPNLNFFGTVWLRHRPLARSLIKIRHLDKRGSKGQCHPRFYGSR